MPITSELPEKGTFDEMMRDDGTCRPSYQRYCEWLNGVSEETANVKVSDLWKEFLRNRPLRVLALFFITAFAMMSVGNAAGAYFMNDLELQTPEAQEGIRWLVCVIPAMLLVLAMFIISKYELTDEKVDEINEEIERRHLQEEEK